MATNYPGSLDTSTQQPSPTASTEMDDSGFEHDVVHTNHSGAIIAVETKVGTGASTPVANSVLGGTGSGTSAWTTTPTLGGLAVSGTISQPWGNEITQTGVANTKFIDVNYTGGIGNHVDLSVPNNGSSGLGDTVMRLVDGGNIGIGAATPDTLLHVSGSTDTVAHFESTDAEGMIAFSDNASTGNWYDRRIGVHGDDLSFVTNGARRMTIQDDGQVGIGTTTPYAPLQVYNSATDTVARFGSGDAGVYISFYDNTSANETNARLGAYGDKLVFLAGGSDRMVIASDGDIGIGTTTPSQRLHVNAGTNNTVAMFESTDTTAYIAVADSDTSSGTYVGIGAVGDALRLRSGNANHFAMDSSGNVGIGTTSPDRQLDIEGNVPAVRLTDSNNAGVYHEILGDGASLSIEADDNNQASSSSINFKVDGTEFARLTSDGRLGIGTNSPANTFHVNGGTDNFVARFESTDGEVYIGLKDSATSSGGHVAIAAIGDDLVLRAGDSNAVRVKDDGKVGIGTTSPGTSLHVNAGATNNAAIFESTDAGALISLKDNTTSGNSYVGLRADGDILKLRSNNTNQVTISANGNVTFLGSLLAPNGSTSAPAYSFANDSNTGFYVTGNGGVIRFVGNGTEGGYVWSGGIRTVDGSASTPAFAFTSDSNTGMFRKAADTIGFATAGNEVGYIDTSHMYITGTDASYVATDPATGTGNDAEWSSVFGVYLLRRNSSLASEKLGITADLGSHLTADMIDQVVPKMWTRDHAPDYPEIGPIADDMDTISPFLGAKGTDANGEQILTGIDRNAYLSLLVLAVKDLRQRVVELEDA